MEYEDKLNSIIAHLTELKNRNNDYPDDEKIRESSKLLGVPFEELKKALKKGREIKNKELVDCLYHNIEQLSSFPIKLSEDVSQKVVSYRRKDWNLIYNDIYKFVVNLIEEDDPLFRDSTIEYCKSLIKEKVREDLIKKGISLDEVTRHWVSSVIVTIDQLDQALPYSRSDITMAVRKMQELGLIMDTSHKGHIREGVYVFSIRGMRALYLELLYGDSKIQFHKFIEANKEQDHYEDLIPSHPSFKHYGVVPSLVLHYNNNAKMNNSYKYCMLKPVNFYRHLAKTSNEIEESLLKLGFLSKGEDGRNIITGKGIKHIEDIFDKADYKELLFGGNKQFTNYDFENRREEGSHFADIVKKWFYQFIHKNETTSVLLERRQNNSILKKGVN